MPLHFDSVTMLPERQVHLVLSGEPGDSVTIQRSSNLTNWVALTNLTNPTGTLEVTDETATNGLRWFYRATSP